jgi:hypothetical protein
MHVQRGRAVTCVVGDRRDEGSIDGCFSRRWVARYVHEEGGRYCLFLADVLLGRVKDYGTEKAEGLSRPPALPDAPHQLYDSVQVGGLPTGLLH